MLLKLQWIMSQALLDQLWKLRKNLMRTQVEWRLLN
jgi:hypothetical protein